MFKSEKDDLKIYFLWRHEKEGLMHAVFLRASATRFHPSGVSRNFVIIFAVKFLH